jgi:hypothetical protein
LTYDYLTGQFITNAQLEGTLALGDYRYLILPPRVGGLYLLGFLDKYVTVSGRQVRNVSLNSDRVTIDLELPAGRSYTFTVAGSQHLRADGSGINSLALEQVGSLASVRFTVDSSNCKLLLRASR